MSSSSHELKITRLNLPKGDLSGRKGESLREMEAKMSGPPIIGKVWLVSS